METGAYKVMRQCEDRHWWYVSLRGILLKALKQRRFPAKLQVLDLGCGTGANLKVLQDFFPEITLVGLDLAPEALQETQKRNTAASLVEGTANALPFRDTVFDLIISTDVLSSWEVETQSALRECFRVLKERGVLVTNLPAFEAFKGRNDQVTHMGFRTTTGEWAATLNVHGFQPRLMTYWNFFLSPALFLWRKFSLRNPNAPSDLMPLPRLLNRILIEGLRLERALAVQFRPPFGSSLFTVAEKNGKSL